jgi:protein transport protein SEC31
VLFDRFHDIAWAPANADHPRGIIAGALENGSLDLWDAEALFSGSGDAFMSRTTKHTGAIKSLQFNPLKPQILATAGAKGELYIYDVNDISNPFRLGNPQARSDDLECIAWNRKVPHILATGSVGGFVTIWDLKTKKASLNLNNNRKAVGAIAWDPNNATKLLTATPDDSSPVILLWDLRNSNAPERTLQGHDQGILSLSWCQQDSDLLLSCGKDNRTVCWNPQSGELLGEFPEVTNWTFQTSFSPHDPQLSATASFDGKIVIQTLQNTNPSANQAAMQGSADGEDFFNKAQIQPQGSSFTLKKAPKWLERPVAASFGFGGKLVMVRLQSTAPGQPRTSKVQIAKFSIDSDVSDASEVFESALQAGDIKGICETHIVHAKSDEEKADWKVIESLIAENPRRGATEFLGFSESDDLSDGVAGSEISGEQTTESQDQSEETTPGEKNKRLSTFFADGGDADDFLSDLAATKTAKTNNPFELFSSSDSASDRKITKALMLGQFEHAMNICLKQDRIADAFVVANCGGRTLLDKAQEAYLSKTANRPNYLRLLSAVIGKNLWDIVYNADLASWKEAMATLCTYADPAEFPDLCEALGDRVLESGSRKDASFCYLVGSKLEKVIGIWIAELQEQEEVGVQDLDGGSAFSVHARSLQNLIEKVTVFRAVTKFEDNQKDQTADWKLAPLYERYVEYADIIASHGYLNIAEKYLELLPTQYPAGEVARNRVKLASRKGTSLGVAREQQPSSTRTGPRAQTINQFQPPHPPAAIQTSAANPYAPSPSTVTSNPYAPTANNPYAPQQGYIPPHQSQTNYGPPSIPTPNLSMNTQASFGAPPRNATSSIPPPSRAKDMVNWNDTPMVTKPSISRRGTPGMTPAPITSPFPNQPNPVAPPSGLPLGPPPRGTSTPPPPPPKGSALPRVISPLSNGAAPSFQQPMRPSSGSNVYAPAFQTGPQGSQGSQLPQMIPRGPSPYNPPPAAAPSTNRYAPAPAPQFSQTPAPHSQIQPPPLTGVRPAPPSNPYAPQQPVSTPQNQYSTAQSPHQHEQAYQALSEPPRGPSTNMRAGASQVAPAKISAPTAPKYPPGDRSHIPAGAQQIVSILSSDMQRVAGKAPPSFTAQVKDTQKRLNILFDHLNNEDLVKPDTVERLNELAQALQARNYDVAARVQVDIQRDKTDECGHWMVSTLDQLRWNNLTDYRRSA